MIPKLKDLITEAKVHRLQIFTPRTGGKGAGITGDSGIINQIKLKTYLL